MAKLTDKAFNLTNMGSGSIGNLTGTTLNGTNSSTLLNAGGSGIVFAGGYSRSTSSNGNYDILGNPIGRYMPITPTPTESFSFYGSLRSSDPIMGFVREFVVEFMRKIDSEYKFVKRNHFDEKTYCKVHDGDFITIRDIFDIQLKEEKDER